MEPDGGWEKVAADEAAAALLGVDGRIADLADIEWHSPAALRFRMEVDGLAADCTALRLRLAAYVPGTW